jgi:hypothetical protein
MNSSNSGFYTHRLISEERSIPPDGWSSLECQPFIKSAPMNPADRFAMNLTREQGTWINALSKEQTAFALAQVSAINILPSLTELDTGGALLDYRVHLRKYLENTLVNELVNVLETSGADLHWGQVDSSVYAAVIGAGVVACIDTTPDQETLYFRYANALVNQLHSAHRAAELPRSLLFLQSALYERFDALLEPIRARTWVWLIG